MYSMIFDFQLANADLFFRLASKSIDVLEKGTAMAVDATRSMVTVAQRDTMGALAERKHTEEGPEQATWSAARAALPSPEKAQSYAREMFNIASDVQAELARWTREQLGAQQETMRTLADQVGIVSDSAARTADQFSGMIRQGAENVSSIAERGARDAAATSEEMSRAAQRTAEQGSSKK